MPVGGAPFGAKYNADFPTKAPKPFAPMSQKEQDSADKIAKQKLAAGYGERQHGHHGPKGMK